MYDYQLTTFPQSPWGFIQEFSHNHIYIKREDLLPYCFGGNKARIAQEYYKDMQLQGCDVMIGYGNSRSNLCRVMANIGRENFYMVQPSNEDGSFTESSNSRLVSLFGSHIITCTRDSIADTIQQLMDGLIKEGHCPYYTNGNAHGIGNEAVPVRAYVRVFEEIQYQAIKKGVHVDYIFLAAGTCMTMSGLICGQECFKNEIAPKIVGMAVAHPRERGYSNLQRYISAFRNACGGDFSVSYEYDDTCLCGGYAKSNEEIANVIKTNMENYGIPMDETYTGKAYWGMLEYIRRKEITGKNILFIHTGGTPLFFDKLLLSSDSKLA